MPSLDQALGIHPQALMLRSRRAAVLAENLANADTPNYQARDFDFQRLLKNAGSSIASPGSIRVTHKNHFNDSLDGGGVDLMYRMPTQASLDQNTVDADAERARFVDNSLRYQASLRFLNGRFSGLKTALRGE